MNFFFRNALYCIKNPRTAWSVRKAMQSYKKEHPACECCGCTEGVEVHHIIPVHVAPEKAADLNNFGSACRKNDCHKVVGHFNNFKRYYNINFKETAKQMLLGKKEENGKCS